MNILFLLHSYPKIGGIEMVTSTVSKFLSTNHKLHYLACISTDEPHDTILGECFYFPSDDKSTWAAYYSSLIDSLEIDVVVNQGPYTPFNQIFRDKSHTREVKLLSFLHFTPGFEFAKVKNGWVSEKKPLKRLVKRVKTALGLRTLQRHPERLRAEYQELYKYSDKVVVLAPGYIDLFCSSYDVVDKSKLVSLTNPNRCVNIDGVEFSEKKKVVLFVGRLEAETKRVDRLIKIWASIKNHNGWRLRIAGDGPHREELEQLTSQLGICDSVEFLGSVKNVEELYREASIIALTSCSEGLGLCLVEGTAFGAIPICFNVSDGVKSIVGEVDDSLLIEPFDEKSYFNKLSELMQSESLREELFSRSIEVSKNYSPQTVRGLWEELLNR